VGPGVKYRFWGEVEFFSVTDEESVQVNGYHNAQGNSSTNALAPVSTGQFGISHHLKGRKLQVLTDRGNCLDCPKGRRTDNKPAVLAENPRHPKRASHVEGARDSLPAKTNSADRACGPLCSEPLTGRDRL